MSGGRRAAGTARATLAPGTEGQGNRGAASSSSTTADWPDEPAGEGVFAVLRDAWAVDVLGALQGAPRTREELVAELSGLSRAGLTRRLARLSRWQLVQARRSADPHGRKRYSLSEPGLELLAVVDEIARVEPRARRGEHGARGPFALALAGGRRTRVIGRALVEGPLSFSELSRRVPHIANAPLTRHLRRLQQAGLVRRRCEPAGGRARYELTDDARRLGRVATLIARWHWRYTPQGPPPPLGDLQGLVHLVAPLARTAPGVAGICLLRQSAPAGAHRAEVYVCVAKGRLRPLALAPAGPVDARAQAEPAAWCEALLCGEAAGLAVEGDRALLAAVIGGLADALGSGARRGRRTNRV
jgi:DNA-binding HxlR family transcriptional regulator